MPSVIRLVFAALALIIVAAPSALADRCLAAKLRAVAKKEYGLLNCQAKPEDNIAACEDNVVAKFSAAFANAGTCSGDPTACEDRADACATIVWRLLVEQFGWPCAKATAKLPKKELLCYASAARRDRSLDPTCITRARDRFITARICTTGSLQTDVEALLNDVEAYCVVPVVGIGEAIALCGVSTTTSTSTSTTTTTSTSSTTTLPFPCDNPGGSCGGCGNGYCLASCTNRQLGTCIDRTPAPPCVTDEDCAGVPGTSCVSGSCIGPFVCSTDKDCGGADICLAVPPVIGFECFHVCETPCP